MLHVVLGSPENLIVGLRDYCFYSKSDNLGRIEWTLDHESQQLKTLFLSIGSRPHNGEITRPSNDVLRNTPNSGTFCLLIPW